MTIEDRGPDRLEAAAGDGQNAEVQGEVRTLRLAEAIADGKAVNWDKELPGGFGGKSPWRGLRTLEAIATYHSPVVQVVSKTPLLQRVDNMRGSEDLPDAWGNLILRERLGRGACASVIRAYDPALDREVALKLPHERSASFSRLFLAEAQRLARIRHENVVEVHGAEECDGQVGMWMDLVEGQSLEECLSTQGPFSANEATLIGIDICRALAAVHHAGLVHRDVKAANVMREAGGRIVLMDFSSVVENNGCGEASNDATTHGTHIYMAPEVLDGEEATSVSDIYSLGVLLYRLVSGRYPIEAESLNELREKHRHQDADSLLDVRPDLPIGFVQVIDRALATVPGERYPTAGEMEHALVDLNQGVRPQKRLTWPLGTHQKSRLWAGLAAVVLIALVLVMGIRALLPGPLTVQAALFRKGALTNEHLAPGDQLKLGDRLFLEVEGSRPMHVYVLNEDAAGRQYVLFPLPGLELRNPLRARGKHRLPGLATVEEEGGRSQVEQYWEVTSRGGDETVMVVTSIQPLQDLEWALESMPKAGSTETALLDMESLQSSLRGIGGITSEVDSDRRAEESSLLDLTKQLLASRSKEIQFWKIDLQNPSEIPVTPP